MKTPKALAMAWYYPQQWDQILAHSKDRVGMAKSYSDWERSAQESVQKLEREGITVHKAYIDVDMLVAWCKRHRMQVDGRSRADYVTHLMAERAGLTKDI